VTSRKMLLSRVTDMEVEEDEFRTGGWMLWHPPPPTDWVANKGFTSDSEYPSYYNLQETDGCGYKQLAYEGLNSEWCSQGWKTRIKKKTGLDCTGIFSYSSAAKKHRQPLFNIATNNILLF
jgi:hypothetical protein